MTAALTLADYPTELVYVACRRCPLLGQYRRTALIARYGEKAPLLEVLAQLARDCPKSGGIGTKPCGAYFPDLIDRPPSGPPPSTLRKRHERGDHQPARGSRFSRDKARRQ